jgi:hypothetical protein
MGDDIPYALKDGNAGNSRRPAVQGGTDDHHRGHDAGRDMR